MNEERFSRAVITVVAKRAANICSNPDCQAITSGPAENQEQAVNVGEAAHIYGARAGAARYREGMSLTERGNITNAIWLCRNCHKQIDNDENHYPAELLFEWLRNHEQSVQERIGKAGAAARHKFEQRKLSELGDLSYRAEQIIISKPRFWEYLLTAEVLRYKFTSIFQRWSDLENSLYIRQGNNVPLEDIHSWYRNKTHLASTMVTPIDKIINIEFAKSWGPPGKPGSEKDIIRCCNLIADISNEILKWEEDVRFSRLPEEFEIVQKLMCGMMGRFLSEINRLPSEIINIFSQEDPEGDYIISLKLQFPDGYIENIINEHKKAVEIAFGVEL